MVGYVNDICYKLWNLYLIINIFFLLRYNKWVFRLGLEYKFLIEKKIG